MRGSLVRQILLLLGLAFLPAIGQAVYYRNSTSWQRPPAVDSAPVTLAQARSWGESVLWLDARPDKEFDHDHIPGALQLNEDRWNELLPGMLAQWSPTRKLVVYCSRESCHASHEVAERLRKEAGLTNVYVLTGGWEEWEEAHR